MIQELLSILKDRHGKDLNLHDDTYYLFLEDGVAKFSTEEDDQGRTEVKIEVMLQEPGHTFVYHEKGVSITTLMRESDGL